MKAVKLFSSVGLFIFLMSGCTPSQKTTTPVDASLPKAVREFRAAWVATVANINWPSKPGLDVAVQKQEAIALLDFLQTHHFNAVILQVRPQADALYKSEIEPWSYYLTGKQGKAPEPFYDPLEFWIKEAHQRGLELHVWLNPYRAHHKDGNEISEQSIVQKHPELVVKLKEGYWWMDPARKEVQDITLSVVDDLVKRYDIDGVHMDDYFYPYPSYNGTDDFPDSVSWKVYQQSGGKLSRGDWRRDAVNQLIERMYQNIKAKKPWVKLGISPFGIWRPGYPEGIEGFDQYDQLYADAKLWLNKGWLDYFTPQLYWPIKKYAQSYPVLLGWWGSENTMQRHLWPGISIGRDSSDKTVDETLNQILIDRGMQPQSKGVVHWSISSVIKNRRLADTLLKSVYKKPALIPASPWLGKTIPAPPVVSLSASKDNILINWKQTDAAAISNFVVYYQYGEKWDYQIVNDKTFQLSLPFNQSSSKKLNRFIVTAVSRTGEESKKEIIKPEGL